MAYHTRAYTRPLSPLGVKRSYGVYDWDGEYSRRRCELDDYGSSCRDDLDQMRKMERNPRGYDGHRKYREDEHHKEYGKTTVRSQSLLGSPPSNDIAQTSTDQRMQHMLAQLVGSINEVKGEMNELMSDLEEMQCSMRRARGELSTLSGMVSTVKNERERRSSLCHRRHRNDDAYAHLSEESERDKMHKCVSEFQKPSGEVSDLNASSVKHFSQSERNESLLTNEFNHGWALKSHMPLILAMPPLIDLTNTNNVLSPSGFVDKVQAITWKWSFKMHTTRKESYRRRHKGKLIHSLPKAQVHYPYFLVKQS